MLRRFSLSLHDINALDYEEALELAGQYLDEEINEEIFRCSLAGIDVNGITRYRLYLERRTKQNQITDSETFDAGDMAYVFSELMRG